MAIRFDIMFIFYFCLFLFSAIAVILGALAWSRSSSLFLPLPIWLPATATLISPLAIVAMAAINTLISKATAASTRTHHRIISIIDQLHSILSTIIATVALAYLFPDNILSCHLEQQWQTFFHTRDARAIRTIEEHFQCCGLRSIHDRAWPFKDRNNGDNACEVQLGFRRSCFTPWREEQQSAAWMVFAAAVVFWAVKIGFVQISRRPAGWMKTRSSRAGDYQRITHPVLGEEHLEGGDSREESRRTLLPQSNSGYDNEWEDRGSAPG